MKDMDLLKFWEKVSNIETELRLHQKEHKQLTFLLISLSSVVIAVFLKQTTLCFI